MLQETAAILCLIVYSYVALAAKSPRLCGKEIRRVNFGKEKLLVSPNTTDEITCRYRIVVGQGLHIQVTFSELIVDPCCSSFKVYDASKYSFQWKGSTPISLPPLLNPGSSVIFPTNNLAIMYTVATSGKSGFSIKHTPVIPADGNCGYELTAYTRERSLTSPGWRKTKTPAGMKCSWLLRAREGYQVYVHISELKTAGKLDFLEVYEGENLLANHSGRLGAPQAYTSERNTILVHYHTTTATSKGFKLKYREAKTGNGAMFPVEEGLACFNRTTVNVAETGANVFSMGSKTQCPPSSTCGLFFVRGTSNTFAGAKVDVEVGACLPKNACDGDPCSVVPPNPEITMTSCEASCCDTDLCNALPSGIKKPQTDLTCYNRTKVNMATTGANIMTQGSTATCPPTSACGLVFIRGTSVPYPGVEVEVEVGVCIPANSCEGNPCSLVPPNPEITMTSCEASCCDSDLCNARPEIKISDEELPQPPEPSGPRPPVDDLLPITDLPIMCYDAKVIESFGLKVTDEKSKKSCRPGEVCLRMNADATMTFMNNIKAVVTFGKCSSASSCGQDFCRQMTESSSSGIPPGTRFDTCSVSCCNTPLCNNP